MAYRFGDFVLDPLTGTLTGEAGQVKLRRQAFLLCEALLRHAPRVVDRDALMDEVWGRSALSPNVLPQTISELRQALGDEPQSPRYIETQHRRGYRMVCEVEEISSPAQGVKEQPDRQPAEAGDPTPAAPRWSRRLGLLAIILVALCSIPGLYLYRDIQHESSLSRLHGEVIPAIRSTLQTDLFAAWRLAREAREQFPGDPALEQLWLGLSLPVTLTSDPTGATIAVGPYQAGAEEWVPLGKTPLNKIRLPPAMLSFSLAHEGRQSLTVAPSILPWPEPFVLPRLANAVEGMVYVPPGPVEYMGNRVELPAYWIQRNEVTNREYAAFVSDGGYQNREHWAPSSTEDPALPWPELIPKLVDSTGLPGPAFWASGTYPPELADHPVEGISWYEAAAYAKWAGHQLPTAFHWWRAAGFGGPQAQLFADTVTASHFNGRATRAVGQGGLGARGTYDMAGNVAEWCANASGDQRHLLGGSWRSDSYALLDPYAQPALQRRRGMGVRLMHSAIPPTAQMLADLPRKPPRDIAPVDDATFALFARQFDYDPAPLDATLVARDESQSAWVRERIRIRAAYGDETLPMDLLLPANGSPPYPVVVHFPGGNALMLDSLDQTGLLDVEPFLRTGRAVAFPVYQGTFERNRARPSGPLALREQLVQQVQDIRRTLDYLETRDDIDSDHVALHAISYGAARAPYALAVEERFTTAMIQSTGLYEQPLPPEITMQHYLPRVTLPVLLFTGRDDFNFSLEGAQQPYFDALGSPVDQKRHVVVEGGHIPAGYVETVRALLAWSDQWLPPGGAP
ncbi:SUMF1/EgtB/PvdO family nonheme iron enzyme [Parahaliea maris]|uniref:SUMF1/EgtB/PvdO family nonheme iron enzyme n=1 Tax=Parahaliea maris TaxID=2716870 RepID=A0A5C9AA84_9GAMM|nr:SUMF1/EgtB/PvdO family nonheme iron enzyme [Parahaliea maris]TXS96201.1 SUMF1/EgtB/PvdO family nonheme iron enzyme [Parahaliea maris]